MNEGLIKNHNALVAPDDIVCHLGDYCFGNQQHVFDQIFNRLNGRYILIEGNHDEQFKITRANRSRFLDYSEGIYKLTLDGQLIVLCHYAMRTWHKSHHGSFHLYGHSHGTLPDDPKSRSFDVGVDCHGYKPVSWEQVKQLMSKKKWIQTARKSNEQRTN